MHIIKNNDKLSLIPLGGLGEIGKNMLVVQYDNEIILVDSGLMFPEDELLGVDVVIPDITYLLENREKIKGIVITHGHEDHIGALPYVLKDIKVPVYGTKLTIALIKTKVKEAGFAKEPKLQVVKPKDVIQLGRMKVEFIRTTHSIPDAVALAIYTPEGTILHTGDFKLDQTPVDGNIADINRMAEIGNEGVLALLSDSTNVEKEGFTMSEKIVGDAFDEQFRVAKERIIIATFASNVHRVKQAMDAAIKYERKIAIAGRSMVNVASIAQEIGYLNIPEGTLIELDEINKYPRNQVAVVTTGSQGEPMSALTRMAKGDHRQIKIEPDDTVILSATPIPGNEKSVYKTIDLLSKLGANVVYGKETKTHVSGHASKEELKMIMNLVKPKYFIPVHGEYRMLIQHAQLAEKMGIPEENILVGENGNVFKLSQKKASIAGKVQSGRVLVDGLGVGDVGNIVLRDRKQLSQDGILIVVVTINKEVNKIIAGPDIVSRGFVYVRESEGLMSEAKVLVKEEIERCIKNNIRDWSTLKNNTRDTLVRFLYERTKRRPMILPIIVEV